MSFSKIFTAAFSASCLVALPVLAQTTSPAVAAANAPVTRDQIPQLVREALINDPTILKDAVEKMQSKQEEDMQKQAKEGIAKNKDKLIADMDSPSVGAKDADVTVVEFFDYHCGYCKKILPDMLQLIEKDKKVRVIFKEFPILSEDSALASRAAIAVNRIAKDKYLDFHKAIFEMKGKFEEKSLFAEAKKLGVDSAKLKAEMAKPEIDAELEKNRKLAADMGIRGTPAVIIGDEFMPGAVPYEALQKAVDATRAAGKKTTSPAVSVDKK
jgi:protein-disulfide isomerase